MLCVTEMSKSTAWKYGIFVVAWLCWAFLSIGAQDSITNPVEGDFVGFLFVF